MSFSLFIWVKINQAKYKKRNKIWFVLLKTKIILLIVFSTILWFVFSLLSHWEQGTTRTQILQERNTDLHQELLSLQQTVENREKELRKRLQGVLKLYSLKITFFIAFLYNCFVKLKSWWNAFYLQLSTSVQHIQRMEAQVTPILSVSSIARVDSFSLESDAWFSAQNKRWNLHLLAQILSNLFYLSTFSPIYWIQKFYHATLSNYKSIVIKWSKTR